MKTILKLEIDTEDVVKAVQHLDYDFACQLRALFSKNIENYSDPRLTIRPEREVRIEVLESTSVEALISSNP